ncbi:MAG: hypothetical protein KAU12_00185 [Candidatus Omnitrophica bacterium]|nr:hypothetical protein [Candidatus Omnitrophota bacterium]
MSLRKRGRFKFGLKRPFFYVYLLVLFLCVYGFQSTIDKIKESKPSKSELLYLPYHKNINRFSLGFNEIIGDILYIKAINYFGEHYLSDRSYPYLYQLLDAATDLSPRFKDVYEFGAIILTFEVDNPDLSSRLLEKAIKNNPDYWRFPFYLSFNNFFYLNNFETAAHYMKEAAILPGSPAYLTGLTARLYSKAGEPETALTFLYQIYEDSDDERVREKIKLRIKEVMAEINP